MLNALNLFHSKVDVVIMSSKEELDKVDKKTLVASTVIASEITANRVVNPMADIVFLQHRVKEKNNG